MSPTDLPRNSDFLAGWLESMPPMRTTMTSTILLEGLKRTANQTVWSDYVDRYRPLILSYARRVGLADADAEDLAQQVLLTFADAYRAGRYDRSKGRLRSWLFGIAKTTLRNHNHRKGREPRVLAGTTAENLIDQLPREGRLSEIWEDEWRQAVLHQCLVEVGREVEPSTLRAFELFARKGWPAEQVAAELNMSENAVYGAKRRVLGRIRELLPQIGKIW
jgi:RNA polymerase sigma factor (sigma-70 family)